MVGLSISCKWPEALGCLAAVIQEQQKKVPNCKDVNWEAALWSSSVSCAHFARRRSFACCLPSGVDSLDPLPESGFPLFFLANRTLICFGQQCVRIQRTDQDWSKPLLASCFLLLMTGLQGGLGHELLSEMGQKAEVLGRGFLLWNKKGEEALLAIISLAFCFGHCHVIPATEQWPCYALVGQIEKKVHVLRCADRE